MNAMQLLDAAQRLIVSDLERWLDLFADTAIIEFPYAASLGTPSRLEGKDEMRAYFSSLPKMEGLSLTNVRRFPMADPNVAWLEMHGSAVIPSTGRHYEQDYVVYARAEDGKLVHYREYWDPQVAAVALGLTSSKGEA